MHIYISLLSYGTDGGFVLLEIWMLAFSWKNCKLRLLSRGGSVYSDKILMAEEANSDEMSFTCG